MAEAKSSQAQKAYESIRDEIVLQHLTPGAIIVESEYGEKLGMSRTPVREALKRLASEGFLTIVPRKGAIVKSYSPRDMMMCHDIAKEVDGALAESLAQRVASGSLSREALQPLFTLLDEMDQLLREERIKEWTACDSRFHELLMELCDNPYIVMCASQLRMHLTRVLWFVTPTHIDKQASNQEHRAVAEAIAAGEPEQAREAARRQSIRIRQELERTFGPL
ncbi:MAG: GntR family transcriptional regulator [Eubacteriales bacterium]|jgi:DNA-binding GntR family transcriptional regulator